MNTLTIGTRGSALALWQARHVAKLLRRSEPELRVELEVIKTRGDKITDVPLAQVGGKGLFVKEIEVALAERRVDLAVHSVKDLPAELAEGLVVGAFPEREDPRDALVTGGKGGLDALAPGSVVGTSSLRRRAQLLHARSDLRIEVLRGNVDTRLAKLDRGEYDAVVLAAAGLKRLGFGDRIDEALDPQRMLPAVGQGALAIEVRETDEDVMGRVAVLRHRATTLRVEAERACLACFGGGCQVPLAAHATLDGDTLTLDALVGHPEDGTLYRRQVSGPAADGPELGQQLGTTILDIGGREVLDEVYRSSH